MRLAFGWLCSRMPVAVWKFWTMISLCKTYTMSASSQTLWTVISSPRTCMPPKPTPESRLPRTSGPTLSSYRGSRSMAPVLRPESGRSTSVSELAFTLTTAPKLFRKSLLTMIGCAPRTKIVAAAFPPRPTRFVLDAPAALFSIRLWATRRSPWCVSITLKLSNVPSMGVCPPP